MGVIYSIIPINDECREWLRSEEIQNVPLDDGRAPTPLEIRRSIESLGGVEAAWSPGSENFGPSAELIGPGEWRTTLRLKNYTGENEPCQLYFSKGWPELVVLVVQAISEITGPFVIYPDTADDIEVVAPRGTVG
jgi:hypothetical protein